MGTMEYDPQPVDLTEIELSESIKDDLERIARNIHEVWAWQRKLRGWEYGEVYNEKERKHPCMTDYDDLPELERDMDRATVAQTIKMLLWLGYVIEKRR